MKRICKAIAGMLAAVFMGQAVLAAPLLGDVNGDGSVTAKDKMTLARYADGWESTALMKMPGISTGTEMRMRKMPNSLGGILPGMKMIGGLGKRQVILPDFL
ncbi:MAG: hypothetical protein II979_00520 [Clostridia bacterium]|nr:hypothetical protein [Clostridia bacterium]